MKAFVTLLMSALAVASGSAVAQVPFQADSLNGVTVENSGGVEPLLGVQDAPCGVFLPHFDDTVAWSSGLVIQNLALKANQVTVLAFANDPIDPVNGGINISMASNYAFKSWEKKAFVLVQGANAEGVNLPTGGASRGTLLLLSEHPLSAFILFGTVGPNIFDSLASTGLVYSGDWVGSGSCQ
jgi:hypothetical protein